MRILNQSPWQSAGSAQIGSNGKKAIETELRSLSKRQVFGPVARTPPKLFPVGYKWVFVRNRDENNMVVRYKAKLVAQGFT
jgi:hypothetical protein